MVVQLVGGGQTAVRQADAASVPFADNAFVRSVEAVLERCEYRRCETGEDVEAICRLRYKAYRAHGFVPVSRKQMTRDEIDDLPNSYRFGVFIDGELVSTVRIHHLTAEHPHAPVMGVYGDVFEPRLERGETFNNPSLLAADPALTSLHRVLPYVTLRLAVIANDWFGTTATVCLIRDEHTAFYRRTFGAEQVGEPRPYRPFTVPVMLYESNCAQNMRPTERRFPFFCSTPMERRMLFGKPKQGELAPLTVLPTARYGRAAA
jgi:hypothetical protein